MSTTGPSTQKKIELTEVSDQVCLLCVRSPFLVNDLIVGANIEAVSFVALGKLVIASLVQFNEILPSPIRIVSLDDGRYVRLKVGVDLEDNLGIEGFGGHFVRTLESGVGKKKIGVCGG